MKANGNGQHKAAAVKPAKAVPALCKRILEEAPRRVLLKLLVEALESGEIKLAAGPAQHSGPEKDPDSGRFLKSGSTSPLAAQFWKRCEDLDPLHPWKPPAEWFGLNQQQSLDAHRKTRLPPGVTTEEATDFVAEDGKLTM